MRKISRTALLPALIAAGVVFSACGGGGASSSPAPYQPHDPYYGYYQPHDPYHDPFAYHNYGNTGYSYSDPLVGAAPRNLAPRAPSDFLSGHLAEFGGAFSGNFAELHHQVHWGHQQLDHLEYLFASNNVTPVPPGFDGRQSLQLRSERDTVSFVTYGLYDPQLDSQVLNVEVEGVGSFGADADSGLYVGVRQFGEPRYRWYGPLTPGYGWRVDTRRNSNLGRGSAAYVTLAVFNSDDAWIDALHVEIGR